MEPVLHLAMEGMMPDPEIEEEHREGVEVGLGRRVVLRPDYLRCHILHCAPDLALGLSVDTDVIVVTDENVAGCRVKHKVAGGDIPVTVT